MIRNTLATTVIAGAVIGACGIAAAQNADNKQTTHAAQPQSTHNTQNADSNRQTTYPGQNAAAKQMRNETNSQNRNMQQAGDRGASANQQGNSRLTTLLVLVPAQSPGAADDKLGDGCWVRFYDGTNFRGQSLTLTGPTEMPRIDVPGHLWHDWDSAIVGPKARVVTYDNENYNDRTAVMNPGQRIPDLGDRKLGWFEEIQSAKVTCSTS